MRNHSRRESLQVNDHYRLIMANKENENIVDHWEVVKKCARRDRDDIFDEESDVSSIEAEWDVWMDVPGDWYFQK